ncbi:YitT family protein [Alkalihalobacillus oceani]|uniref:YitT family protein n=1 Tax=Halalkalibacter oceani TaxID=1653776 RepID=UPI00203B984E|nr:YitT family protein [Halalkalibacter oceani]MCM3759654.1 YitT family protein [Halalkalibacter oceani]
MRTFFHYLLLTIGSIFVAAGLELILAPNGLVDGGVTAIAIMANELFDWPIWVGFLALNIPSLLFSGRFMGRTFVIRTLYANVITAASLAWLGPMLAITSSEVLIVLYGGLLLGLGVGLVVKAGGAVDGTEMIAIWAQRRFHIPVSTFLLAINAFILTGAAFVFTLEQAMFSVAVFYIVSKMIDFVLDGLNQGKSVMIISDTPHKVGQKLLKELDVSITYLYGQGGYTGDERLIIYCITNRFVYPKLKEVVMAVDPSAVLEAYYVSETSGVKKATFFNSTGEKKD